MPIFDYDMIPIVHDGKHHVRLNPNGTITVSTVAFPPKNWWDSPKVHFVWSWTSWVTWIIADFGWHGPRNWFKKSRWFN